jgi:hypothetical protein
MPAAAAMATRCMVWLVEPPVACSPTMPLTKRTLVEHFADRHEVVAVLR